MVGNSTLTITEKKQCSDKIIRGPESLNNFPRRKQKQSSQGSPGTHGKSGLLMWGLIAAAWGLITEAGQWVCGIAYAIPLPWWASLLVAPTPVAVISWFRGRGPRYLISF